MRIVLCQLCMPVWLLIGTACLCVGDLCVLFVASVLDWLIACVSAVSLCVVEFVRGACCVEG